MNNWKETIVEALTELGGLSHYSDLYEKIIELKGSNLPNSWKQTVRRFVQDYSSDSDGFKNREDLFYSVDGIGSGVWGLRNYIPEIENIDFTEDDISFPEGKLVLRKHVLRERNPKLIIEAKKVFREKNGKLFCEVCGFDFKEKYGELGADFIEGHHVKPISELKEEEYTKIEDIVMVCSNCHKMLHRRRPWLDKNTLQDLIKE